MAITKTEFLNALVAFKEVIDDDYGAKFVQKDGAKVLSTNDFTDALKAKLDGIVDETITRAEIENAVHGGGSVAS